MVKTMKTVKELIDMLEDYPQDYRVIVTGYEGGYCDIDAIGEKDIVLNVHQKWYYGPHEDEDYYLCKGKKADEKAILIG